MNKLCVLLCTIVLLVSLVTSLPFDLSKAHVKLARKSGRFSLSDIKLPHMAADTLSEKLTVRPAIGRVDGMSLADELSRTSSPCKSRSCKKRVVAPRPSTLPENPFPPQIVTKPSAAKRRVSRMLSDQGVFKKFKTLQEIARKPCARGCTRPTRPEDVISIYDLIKQRGESLADKWGTARRRDGLSA